MFNSSALALFAFSRVKSAANHLKIQQYKWLITKFFYKTVQFKNLLIRITYELMSLFSKDAPDVQQTGYPARHGLSPVYGRMWQHDIFAKNVAMVFFLNRGHKLENAVIQSFNMEGKK